MPGNHPLWPNRHPEQFERFVRVKEHPDSQPRSAVTVDGGDYDDGDADQKFEGKWIDGLSSL
jgi:hypothetical protein